MLERHSKAPLSPLDCFFLWKLLARHSQAPLSLLSCLFLWKLLARHSAGASPCSLTLELGLPVGLAVSASAATFVVQGSLEARWACNTPRLDFAASPRDFPSL